MNKVSRLKSGWLSILKNERQLLAHPGYCNNIASICNAVHCHMGFKKVVYKQTESSPRRVKEDEQVVQDLLKYISEFECFPFDPAASTRRTLESAIPVSDELSEDLKFAYLDGEAKLSKLLEEYVFTKVKSLFDSVPKNKLLAFAIKEKKGKETSTSGKGKVTSGIMESVGMTAIIEIVKKSGLVTLSKKLQYRITLSVFNANGTFWKVQNSKLIQKLKRVLVVPRVYVAIIDLGTLSRMATPTQEDHEKSDPWGILSPRLSISLFPDIS